MVIRIVAELHDDSAHSRLTVSALSGMDKIEYLEIRPDGPELDPESVVRGHLAYRVVGPRNVATERRDKHIADAENVLTERAGKSVEDLTWADVVNAADKQVKL